jgi:hypothetical protein
MNPWQFVNRFGRIACCSWCQREQGVIPLAEETHGICPKHEAEFRAAAKQTEPMPEKEAA